MGCYPPLVKFVSRALRKCNGRDRWREERLDYAMAYPPGPPMEVHYMRPVARTVTFASNNNVYVIPPQKPPSPPQELAQEQQQSAPEPPQQQPQQAPPQHELDHHDQDAAPQPQPEPPSPAEEKAPDAPPPAPAEPKPPRGPKRGKNKKPGGRVRFGPDEPSPPQEEQQEPQQEQRAPDPGNGNASGQEGQQHGRRQAGPQVPAYLFRYTPSPLPRWEATPRRHEYFSGEYRSYYPTPVREGIYRIATDANKLTTIFSEENPNACAIV